MNKVTVEITADFATVTLAYNNKTYSETLTRQPFGYQTTGKAIDSQLEEEYSEDLDDADSELLELVEAIDDLDVTDVMEKINNLTEE